MFDYDLLVIGSGPGGQKAAIAAAKLDRRVAIIERPDMIGGVCVNTGTIPSKTLREAILYLTGVDQREIYGQSYRLKDEITVADLTARTSHVVNRENDVVRAQLTRNRVTIIPGLGYFVGPRSVEVDDGAGRTRKVTADKIVIATGTRPARPASVAFDDKTIIDSDGIIHLGKVPRTMVVAGAGVIDRKLLGVHVFGTGATELIHIGQSVMGCGGTVDYLVDAVFNYPTLAESYKVAALDATNKMRQVTRLSGLSPGLSPGISPVAHWLG